METRRQPRVETKVKINLEIISATAGESKQKFSLSGGKAFEVQAVDISILGVGITHKSYLPKGLNVYVEIDGGPFGLDGPMKIKGEIRYCIYVAASVYHSGVKFIDIASEYQDKIGEFVVAHERRKAPRLKLSE